MQGVSKDNNNNSSSSRRWTPEDKTRIVMESLTTTNITVAELCRKYNLNPNVFYNWKQKFIEGGRMALSGSTKGNINKDLETENERLKRIIGEQTIAIDAFKKTLETGRKG